MAEGVDFHIDTKPVSITLRCPHCDNEVVIPWHLVNDPDYWGDDWGTVDCPVCQKEVKLGEYDYD